MLPASRWWSRCAASDSRCAAEASTRSCRPTEAARYVKEASDLLPNRLMKPNVIWLHDDMANAMGDVCDDGMVHCTDCTLRPVARSSTAARYDEAVHAA